MNRIFDELILDKTISSPNRKNLHDVFYDLVFNLVIKKSITISKNKIVIIPRRVLQGQTKNISMLTKEHVHA